jgi:hypothetical protein
MPEIKLTGPSMEQRIANRLRNSGGGDADVVVQKGTGPTRTITNVHRSRVAAHGSGGPEKPEGRGLDERGRGRR